MGPFDLLVKIIKEVVGDVPVPPYASENKDTLQVRLKDESNEEPVVFRDDSVDIYARHPAGALLKEQVLSQSEALMQKGDRTVEAEFGELIKDAVPFAQMHEEDRQLLEACREFVPERDILIISDALFIRRLYKNGGSVVNYKQMMYHKYQSRGNNITNLVSAEYYENHIIPVWRFLKDTEGDLAKKIFSEFYEEAVTQYPFAVFVSNAKTKAQLNEEIINKIKFNISNDQHILNIHGIGSQNKRTIISVVNDSDIKKYYVSEPDIVELEKSVYARIYF